MTISTGGGDGGLDDGGLSAVEVDGRGIGLKKKTINFTFSARHAV